MKLTASKMFEALALPFTYGFKNMSKASSKKKYPDEASNYVFGKDFYNSCILWYSRVAGAVDFGILGATVGSLLIPVPILGPAVGLIAFGYFGYKIGDIVGEALNTKNLRQTLTAISFVAGAIPGAVNGSKLGAVVGTLTLGPGLGTTIGSVLGFIGGGLLTGSVFSSAASFLSKHASRAMTALFNTDSVNPTNPRKYQVVPPSDVDSPSYTKVYSMTRPVASAPQSQGNLYPNVMQYEAVPVQINEAKVKNSLLEKCHTWKKLYLRTDPVSKFFRNETEQEVNKELNGLIESIHNANYVMPEQEIDTQLSAMASRLTYSK